MLQEVVRLQEKLLEQLRAIRVEGSAGGGMVRVEMDGEQRVISVRIEPQVFADHDVAMLQDLIVAACADARRAALEKAQENMRVFTGIPPRS